VRTFSKDSVIECVAR